MTAPVEAPVAGAGEVPAGFDAFDQLATMVALADPDGHCLYANSALENTLGVSRRTLQRGSVLDWLGEAAQFADTLRLVARNEIATSRFDATMKRAGGSELPVHVIVSQTDWPQRVLVELIEIQLAEPDHWAGGTFNVGGGREVSLSLQEATGICARLTGHELEIGSIPEDRKGDVPLYLSDCSKLYGHTSWRPRRDAECVLADIHDWLETDRERFGKVLG